MLKQITLILCNTFCQGNDQNNVCSGIDSQNRTIVAEGLIFHPAESGLIQFKCHLHINDFSICQALSTLSCVEVAI